MSAATKVPILDRCNIIFSASKGETSNQLGGADNDTSLLIDTKRDDIKPDIILSELNFSGESVKQKEKNQRRIVTAG